MIRTYLRTLLHSEGTFKFALKPTHFLVV